MFSAALAFSSQQLSVAAPWLLLKMCFFYFSAISCSVLSAPEYGELNCSHIHGNFTFGSTCAFSCQPGFVLMGPQSRECMAKRTWTGDTSRCKGRTAARAHSVTDITTGLPCAVLSLSVVTQQPQHHMHTQAHDSHQCPPPQMVTALVPAAPLHCISPELSG